MPTCGREEIDVTSLVEEGAPAAPREIFADLIRIHVERIGECAIRERTDVGPFEYPVHVPRKRPAGPGVVIHQGPAGPGVRLAEEGTEVRL